MQSKGVFLLQLSLSWLVVVVCICSLVQNNSSRTRILARHMQTLTGPRRLPHWPNSPAPTPRIAQRGRQQWAWGRSRRGRGQHPIPQSPGGGTTMNQGSKPQGSCSTVSSTSLTKYKFKDQIFEEFQNADCTLLLWALGAKAQVEYPWSLLWVGCEERASM